MKNKFLNVFGIILICAGLNIFFWPSLMTGVQFAETQVFVRTFQEMYGRNSQTENGSRADEALSFEDDSLYREIQDYNQSIYENDQEGFRDPWSYEQAPVSLEGLEDGIFGYIEIPALGQTLPLYIGASMDNMNKGAAILGQTSIPIGGTNTNSVIAGHRGWAGKPYFKEIENISPGDQVYITNPWETLVYTVCGIDIIDPYDNDAVKIQAGRDMVTLLTCHPYASGGQYRYLVYCTRDMGEAEDKEEETQALKGTYGESIVASDGTVYESSEYEINREIFIRRTGIAVLSFFTAFYIAWHLTVKKQKAGKKKRR